MSVSSPTTVSTQANTTIRTDPTTTAPTAVTAPSEVTSPAERGSVIHDILSNRSYLSAAMGSSLPAPSVDASTTASTNTTTSGTDSSGHSYIIANGRVYYAGVHRCHYHICASSQPPTTASLIDGGANGGMAGEDVLVLDETFFTGDVTGVADAVISDLKITTVAGLIDSVQGPIIGIFHQFANYRKGKSVHSVPQFQDFKA